jgi:hypothetical protein
MAKRAHPLDNGPKRPGVYRVPVRQMLRRLFILRPNETFTVRQMAEWAYVRRQKFDRCQSVATRRAAYALLEKAGGKPMRWRLKF